jgi:hypothetical protein
VRSNADPVHRVPQRQRLLPERARIEVGHVGEPLLAAPHAVDQHIEAALLVRDPIDHSRDLIIAAGIHRRGDPGTAQPVTCCAVSWTVPGSRDCADPYRVVRPVT